jgi:hypothetical protein
MYGTYGFILKYIESTKFARLREFAASSGFTDDDSDPLLQALTERAGPFYKNIRMLFDRSLDAFPKDTLENNTGRTNSHLGIFL